MIKSEDTDGEESHGDGAKFRSKDSGSGNVKSGDADNKMPKKYSMDHVAAIPKSPTSLFVYWELSGPRSKYYQKEYSGEVEWRLSLINLDEEGEINWVSEVKIAPDAGNHYLRVQPGNRYRVELGVKLGGVFHPICHTRERIMPSDTPSSAERGAQVSAGIYAEKKTPGEEKQRESIPLGLKWQENILKGMRSS